MKSVQDILKIAYRLTMEHLNERSHVGELLPPKTLLSRLDLKLNKTAAPQEAIEKGMKDFLKYSANTLSPQFQNQLFSGFNPYALAGDWLTSIVNTTMSTYEASPVGTLIEKELIGHLNSIIGWGPGDGIMVTGGSNANLISLLLARNILYPDTKQNGSKANFSVFVSEESHYSFDKAINLMGLGTKNLIKVKADDAGRMLTSDLVKKIEEEKSLGNIPLYVAATSGTTVLGEFDPIKEISDIAKRNKMWFHVDGAWGGSTLLSKKHRGLMEGVELADSMTWDTHKMLGTGLISSFILTKHIGALKTSNDSGNADYLFHDSETASWDLGPASLQCGRRIDSFKVWLMWKALGDEGLEKLVDDLFAKAQATRELIKSYPDFELIHDGRMLNICFNFRSRVDSNEAVIEVRKKLLAEGNHFVNYSTRHGVNFFRMIIANPELTLAHTKNFLDQVLLFSKK